MTSIAVGLGREETKRKVIRPVCVKISKNACIEKVHSIFIHVQLKKNGTFCENDAERENAKIYCTLK
jgi:hypothetical protein